MAETLDCSPCYTGRPDYNPNLGTAVLPLETLARSRLFAGATFFRSKLAVPGDSDFQGAICNSISIAVIQAGAAMDLVIYFEDIEVERYATTQDVTCPTLGGGVAIPALRSATSSSQYISMPTRDTDTNDPGGVDGACLTPFAKTAMTGGDGPGEAEVAAIRTGPDRTIAFISSKENANGVTSQPGAGSNLIQWNYDTLQWIAYVIDADCALPANRCP